MLNEAFQIDPWQNLKINENQNNYDIQIRKHVHAIFTDFFSCKNKIKFQLKMFDILNIFAKKYIVGRS